MRPCLLCILCKQDNIRLSRHICAFNDHLITLFHRKKCFCGLFQVKEYNHLLNLWHDRSSDAPTDKDTKLLKISKIGENDLFTTLFKVKIQQSSMLLHVYISLIAYKTLCQVWGQVLHCDLGKQVNVTHTYMCMYRYHPVTCVPNLVVRCSCFLNSQVILHQF